MNTLLREICKIKIFSLASFNSFYMFNILKVVFPNTLKFSCQLHFTGGVCMRRIFRYSMRGMVMFIITALSCLSAGTTLAQVAETVCFLPWGDNTGEIGLLNKPEVEKCGPLAFCVDGTGIFLLDSVHEQVLGVDKAGNAKVIAQKVGGWAICGDGTGGVFVQETDHILSLNTQGKKTAFTLKNKSGKAPRLIEGYGNELFADSNGVLCVRAVTQKVYPVSDAPRIKRPSAVKSSPQLHYIIKRMLKNEVRILGLDDNDKALVSIPVQIDDGQAGAVLFKGTDVAGNVYVEVECIKNGHVQLQVHSYSPTGSRITVFSLPNNYFTTVYKKTEISPEGLVYQMLTMPDGVRILRYGKE